MKNRDMTLDIFDATDMAASARGPGGGQGNPGGGQGNPGDHGNPGGGNGGGSTEKGVLYGDQIVVLRDLDPTDGGGNGEPVLDTYNDEPQLIAVGDDASVLFPIYFTEIAEGDYEIPADLVPFVQAVELERANVARAPTRVMEKALDAAVDKLETALVIETDAAGRLMYSTDGTTFLTIDSPLENLALYQALMTAGTSGTWTGVQEDWDSIKVSDGFVDLSFLATLEGFDVTSLLAAAWAKEGEITLDAVIYENTTLGINVASNQGGELTIDYFDFSAQDTDTGLWTETYDYVRSVLYADTWLRWIEIDPGTGQPVFDYGTVFDAVFGGVEWDATTDRYLVVDTLGDDDPSNDVFVLEPATASGLNDFAQAADDARAVIEFIHANQAVEVDVTEVPDEFLFA